MSSLVPSLIPLAKPGCPDASRSLVEAHISTMPTAWRVPPHTGETFASVDAFKDRMVGWSFCEGFWLEEAEDVQIRSVGDLHVDKVALENSGLEIVLQTTQHGCG